MSRRRPVWVAPAHASSIVPPSEPSPICTERCWVETSGTPLSPMEPRRTNRPPTCSHPSGLALEGFEVLLCCGGEDGRRGRDGRSADEGRRARLVVLDR